MIKKILLIIGIILIVGLALFLIFTSKPQTEGVDQTGFSIRDYLPFGNSSNGSDSNTANQDIVQDQEIPVNIDDNKPIPRLRRISNEPIAGAVIFNTGATSTVRFIEKGTGNVYEAKSDSLNITRLTNTTIPKIIRAFWLPDGSGFLAQNLLPESEIIETNFVKLNKNTASSSNENLTPFGTTIGKLPTGIKEISIKPDGTKIFYYIISSNSSSWFISNPDGTKSDLVMSHPLTEWVPKWISTNFISMQTKGSSEAVGYGYIFDIKNKVLEKNGFGFYGLSVNPHPEGFLNLASSGGSSPQLFITDTKNVFLNETSINTLADKCLWLKDKSPTVYCAVPNQIPSGNYPDAWYKSLISTEDFIAKIDLANDSLQNVAEVSLLSDQKIDVVDLSISPDETHLVFRNKIDGYLWMLRIEE